MLAMPPQKSNAMGEVRIVDSGNFPAAVEIANGACNAQAGGPARAALASQLGRVAVFYPWQGPHDAVSHKVAARTADFNAGDIGYVPVTLGHYIENTGDTDLVFLEMCKFAVPGYFLE
jgi:oxalate decarboxylase